MWHSISKFISNLYSTSYLVKNSSESNTEQMVKWCGVTEEDLVKNLKTVETIEDNTYHMDELSVEDDITIALCDFNTVEIYDIEPAIDNVGYEEHVDIIEDAGSDILEM